MKAAKTPHAPASPISIPFALPEPFPFIDVDVNRPRRIRVRMLPLADLLALPDDLRPERYYLAGSVAVSFEVMPLPNERPLASEPDADRTPVVAPSDRPEILPFATRPALAAR